MRRAGSAELNQAVFVVRLIAFSRLSRFASCTALYV
jgi:hypothetical protein